jgi:hypothetical protein
MTFAPAAVPIASFGFNVPCRRFLITANITRDRRLPVVDEFILRLLKIADSLPIARLGNFFGFTPNEIVAALSDLQGRGLVELNDNDVELSPAAHELFLVGRGGAPEMLQVETWAHRIWFDLISKNMMTPERKRPLENLIDLKPPALGKELLSGFARTAFEGNFQEFLRKIARVNNPDKFALYSVSDVAPDRYGSVVLSGTYELQLEPEPKILPRLLGVEPSQRLKFRPLSEAMLEAVRRLSEAEPSLAGLTEFRRLTADRSISRFINDNDSLRLTDWLTHPENLSNVDRVPVFGASYLPRNVTTLVQALERRALERLKTQNPRQLHLRWYRPAGSSWGASRDLQEALATIAGTVKSSLSSDWSLATALAIPAAARKDAPRFQKLFDRVLAAPSNHMASATEILSISGVAAMVFTQVEIAKGIAIPVGWILVDLNDVARVDSALGPDSGYEVLSSRSRHELET